MFWFLALLLDFSDGTLARMTDQVGKSALRVDHISDLFKISTIFLGFAMFFNDPMMWVLCFLSSTSYLFYTVLNHELAWVTRAPFSKNTESLHQQDIEIEKESSMFMKIKNHIKSQKKLENIIRKFFFILTINGHTLLIFFLIPISQSIAILALLYFIFIVIFQSIFRLQSLSSIPRR